MSFFDNLTSNLSALGSMGGGTWLDQLQPASFRGVGFQVDSTTRSPGNNTVLREYPFQDLPTIFSMGEAAEEIKFSAYVVGNDYMDKANALEQALKVQESGVLIHPTIGAVRVWHHGTFEIQEAYTTDGGVARFTLTFVRADARRNPAQATNTGLSAFAAALQAKLAIVQDFVNRYSLSGVAGWVRENVLNNLLALHGAVFEVLYMIRQGTDGVEDIIGLANGADGLLKDMLLAPADLGAHFARLFDVPKNLTPEQAAYATAQLMPVSDSSTFAHAVSLPALLPARDPNLSDLLQYAVTPAYSPYITPSRQAEANACVALQTLVRQLTWVALIQTSAQMEMGNYDVTLGIRGVIHSHYELFVRDLSSAPQANTAGVVTADSLDVYQALAQAHACALTHLQQASTSLARLTSHTPQTVDNLWAISYQLYGSPGYAEEIWAMNPHITNPLLVPAGVALRVVDHG